MTGRATSKDGSISLKSTPHWDNGTRKRKHCFCSYPLPQGHECTLLDYRSERRWCTLPGSKPSAFGSDRKRTSALLYRSWPELGEERTNRPRSWPIVQGVWPAGPITQTTTQVKKRRRYTLSKRRWERICS